MLNFLKLFVIFIVTSVAILYFTKKDSRLVNPHLPVITEGIPAEIEKAESANILIIGSGISEYITPVVEEIGEQYKGQFRRGLRVFNWSEKDEGIHRTLHKWKSLKKKPFITIFLGGEAEFYERKFMVKDIHKIKKNIQRIKDPKLATLLSIIPQVAPYILNSVNKFIYDVNMPSKKDYPLNDLKGAEALKYIEFNLKLFKYFLNQLVMEVRASNQNVIFITYPVNPKTAIHRVCNASKTSTISDTLYEINDLRENGKTEKALKISRILSKKALGNAEVFYTRAKLEERSNNQKSALRLYELAHIFDCGTKEANKVTNKIVQTVSFEYGVEFIDFYEMIIQDFGKQPLFIDGKIPQEMYFSKLKRSLKEKISEMIERME